VGVVGDYRLSTVSNNSEGHRLLLFKDFVTSTEDNPYHMGFAIRCVRPKK
jgi:hypothetical protein